MRLKHHILLYTFLGVAVLISIFLTLDYGNRAQRSAQALEDAYAQRVLETQEHLQAIGLKLGKAPVATDARTQVELLAGISRQADNVVSGLSALPLSHIAMSDTLKFCNQLSEYAMVLALSVSAGQPLTEQQTTELSALESQCALLLGQFATARETMVAESLRLTAQPGVFYAEAQAGQRPLEQVADPDNGMTAPFLMRGITARPRPWARNGSIRPGPWKSPEPSWGRRGSNVWRRPRTVEVPWPATV